VIILTLTFSQAACQFQPSLREGRRLSGGEGLGISLDGVMRYRSFFLPAIVALTRIERLARFTHVQRSTTWRTIGRIHSTLN